MELSSESIALTLLKKKINWELFLTQVSQPDNWMSGIQRLKEKKSNKKEPLSLSLLADTYARMEKYDLRVECLIMNPKDFSTVKNLIDTAYKKNCNWEKSVKEKKKGIRGALWGAIIFVSAKVPLGTMAVLSEYQFAKIVTKKFKTKD